MTHPLGRRQTTAERILALLDEHEDDAGLTRAEVRAALGMPLGTVDRAVIALVERGAARQANVGVPARYVATGRDYRPLGHLASAPTPQEVDAPILVRHLTYLRTRNLSTAYVDQRRRALLNLAAWAGRPLLDLSPVDLERWQSTVLPGRSSGRSRNTLTSHVRGFYRWAHVVEEGHRRRPQPQARARQGRPAPAPPDRPCCARARAGRRSPAHPADAVPRRLPGPPSRRDRRPTP